MNDAPSLGEEDFAGWLHTGTGESFMRLPRVGPRADELRAAGITAAVLGFPSNGV